MGGNEPWYRRIRRWGQTNLTEDDPERNNIGFWKEQWKRTKVQGLIINCGGIVAYYPSKFGLQYRAATLGDRDYYAEFSGAAREAGLAVIARMDINRATEEFYEAHPDWFSVNRDGEPCVTQGRYLSCVNSDYYKKFIPDVLTEIIEKYHPDGFADNSWKGLGRKQICYCTNCRRRFRQDLGLELPDAPDFSDPVYRKWVRWSADCRTENWKLFNEVTQRVGGEDCLWFGMINADPFNDDQALVDMKTLLNMSKFVFTDHQSRDMLNGFEQNHENGDLLRMASDENNIVPESLANYVRGERTFRLAANPPEETRMWTISGAAGGISPWYHHIGGGTWDRRQFETPVPFFRWHAENEKYLYDRTNLANVAVCWSKANAVFYGRDSVKERAALPWRGVLSALHEGRIPFFPVHMDDIRKYADRIDTFVLPDVEVMSEEQVETVLEMIRLGKNLVITGLPGALDEEGEPRNECRILEALGIRLTGKAEGSFESQPSSWEYPLAHTYLHLFKERHPVFEGFEDTDIIGFGGGIHGAEADGSSSAGNGTDREDGKSLSGVLKPVCGYVKPFPIYPPEFSWIREIDDTVHPIFAGTAGSGSKIVWLAADVDRCCGRNRLPDHMKLIENAVRWCMSAPLPVEVSGEGFVDLAVYRQGDHRILHMNNLSFANVTGYCHRILPVHDLSVSMDAEGAAEAEIRFLVSGEQMTVRAESGKLNIPVQKIHDHEVLVITGK